MVRNGGTQEFHDFLRAVPFLARGKPQLLRFLRSRSLIGQETPTLKVIGVFDVGGDGGLMCHFVIQGQDPSQSLVAPAKQLSLRLHKIDRGNQRKDRSRAA